ncbi:hypothetical protein B296_00036127 [Ensete ventricosum]|uniref:5-oxoprolinase n=1 Tax=Ensete ventricosum TaxID=4639 RepID=A0A427A3M9_ENSVE|nr:hypothetical protein B296_00036127 [Ensete ventricosum]
MGSIKEEKFRFCIDRGGTFTDIYAEVPGQSECCVMKLLSVDPLNYDDAPIEGVRRILEEFSSQKIPRSSKIPTDKIEWIRMGTTVATNALLERKARPNIFDLTVSKPSNLYEEVVEVDERIELPIDVEGLRPSLKCLLDKGINCLAVVLMHSYTYPHHEILVEKLALSMGFRHVSLSSALTPMVRAVPRGLTATVDAYLTPVIKEYLSGFMSRFEGGAEKVNVLFMQSDGGLAPEQSFSGHKAVLSGPAGGVVGYSQTLFGLETSKPLIGFDMGGTSTDVSGGSKLKFQFGAFHVGPESVGAHPGPVCYRKGGELAHACAIARSLGIESVLLTQVRQKLRDQGFGDESINTETYLNLRYEGTDTAIMIKQPTGEDGIDYAGQFERMFQKEYGFKLQNRKILICDVRVRGIGITNILKPRELEPSTGIPQSEGSYKIYFGKGWLETPLFKLEKLGYGHTLHGPAIIMNGNSTIIVELNCKAMITKYGNIRIEINSAPTAIDIAEKVADVVQLSIFNHRFMGIAEQMGRTLQRTSISTNIKERLDFSCAVFGPDGGLVANAPHVPVHLGAMSSTVCWQLNYWGENLYEGDVLVSNHPCAGGSHLPDITVITPVFDNGKLVFFVASRGHHAEIGGITPGSMPPFSKSIWEEGAAIKAFKLVEGGIFQEEGIVNLLQTPALIKELIDQYGLETVQAYMSFGSAVVEEEDYMDDGSAIHLKLSIDAEKGEANFDFEGTSPEVYGNWNAPQAVTAAAVIYCLRCLVDVDIPLNQGCLAPVTIHIPEGSFLSPSDKAAVVGGNVLTSQRITDVILTAFQACACSQGCMNNLTFGDDTFGYYETIGGGSGAGPTWDGTSGIQCHMTNTRMTDPEIFEQRYPVLLHMFGLRENSGGAGYHRGGDGLIREIEFRRPVVVSILSERRVHAPRGLKGGMDGARGANYLIKKDKRRVYLGGKNSLKVDAGEILQICTPGGGGFGSPL